jgi:cysteine desulfurase/selenocysteine lyase
MPDLERKLYEYRGRVKLVAVTGASNVTGYINPIHDIARLAHSYGAQVFIDAAQLIQHRKIDMTPQDRTAKIDYLAFSAHKIYAPFFTGALIGPKEVLYSEYPLYYGAGMAELVTEREIILKESPERYEAGSNNILGAIALACSLNTIEQTGMGRIQRHESELLDYGIERLMHIPGVILYGDSRRLEDRVPIIAYNVSGKTHEETARYLYDDYGIIGKNGFCGSDLYVEKLTEGSPHTGIVRASLALYNEFSELDRLAVALGNFR